MSWSNSLSADSVALVTIAALNTVTAFLTYRTHQTAMETHKTAVETNKNMERVEVATNSMKDALVATTAAASHAEGELKGRRDVRSEMDHGSGGSSGTGPR